MPRPVALQTSSSASGRLRTPDYHQPLTPRTPHSRSGRAEEALTEIELDEIPEPDDDYRKYGQQQTEPLLASSADGSFAPSGYRSRGDDYDQGGTKGNRGQGLGLSTILQRIPLVSGIFLAGLLLVLVVVSLERPEALQRIVGGNATSSESSVPAKTTAQEELVEPSSTPIPSHPYNPHIISYENYTKFPLLPTEYLAECDKLNQGFKSHGGYWTPNKSGPLDVLHHDENHDYGLPEGELTKVCDSTITYMLDGHVGLLADLALIAQAAALAREVCGQPKIQFWS